MRRATDVNTEMTQELKLFDNDIKVPIMLSRQLHTDLK